MSAPHPEGVGARRALHDALESARLTPASIDYINLHGTASLKNDEVEARLVADLFPARTFASSTKGWTGHTLGAAGIVEAAISLIALEHGLMPGTLNTEQLDPACGPQIRCENERRRGAAGAEFLLRLRRQQLRAGVRPGRLAMNARAAACCDRRRRVLAHANARLGDCARGDLRRAGRTGNRGDATDAEPARAD